MNPHAYLTERQFSWARRQGIMIDEAGYMDELNDNLFLPLTPEVLGEFPRGRSGELDDSIHAAHSSTALVVNVFYYWRLYDNLEPIISAICPNLVNYQVQGLVFEAGCPINWPVPQLDRKAPHLDVIITYRDKSEPSVTKAIAIESKFRESYGQDQGPFADGYVSQGNEAIWKGFEPLQELAIRINRGEKNIFQRLKVAQLIKHILGMNSRFHGTQNFELLYLWYPAPGPEAVKHEEEIRRFEQMTKACRPQVKFRSITYQDLIHSLTSSHGDAHGAYIDYLTERYF